MYVQIPPCVGMTTFWGLFDEFLKTEGRGLEAHTFKIPRFARNDRIFRAFLRELLRPMVRKQEKTPEEIEQEFREEIGMGDWLSRTLVGFYSLFDKGKTRLCLAVLFGRTEEVERALFFHPELVDSCWNLGPHPRMTLLHCAAIALRNREMTLELLLKQGLDPKAHDGDGLAPIEYALHDAHDPRNRRVIKLLREHGAF